MKKLFQDLDEYLKKMPKQEPSFSKRAVAKHLLNRAVDLFQSCWLISSVGSEGTGVGLISAALKQLPVDHRNTLLLAVREMKSNVYYFKGLKCSKGTLTHTKGTTGNSGALF